MASKLGVTALYVTLHSGKWGGIAATEVNSVWQFVTCLIHTGTHMPYGIVVLEPPGRGDISDLTPAEACTGVSDPGGMQG